MAAQVYPFPRAAGEGGALRIVLWSLVALAALAATNRDDEVVTDGEIAAAAAGAAANARQSEADAWLSNQ